MERRNFLYFGFTAAGVLGLDAVPLSAAGPAVPADPHIMFPGQDPALVRAVVGASHANIDRVRELVDASPALAKSSWDWGFGDWESALGAASHTGRREIAEYLISKGARPNLFTAAMLGQLDVVRGMIEAQPGIESIHGPHGITLLAHARFGREPAAAVYDYLETLGTADPRQGDTIELDSAQRARFVGIYTYGTGATERIEIEEDRDALWLKRTEGTRRQLSALDERTFFPAGAPAVHVVFSGTGDDIRELRIVDAQLNLRAERR